MYVNIVQTSGKETSGKKKYNQKRLERNVDRELKDFGCDQGQRKRGGKNKYVKILIYYILIT